MYMNVPEPASNCDMLSYFNFQLIWLGTRQQLLKLDFALLAAQFPRFTVLTSVRDLGVSLDNTLSFSAHISNLSQSSFYHLRRLRAVRRSVSMPVFKSMVHAMPVPGLIIVTPSSLAYQNPAWLHCNLSLMRQLV